MPPFVIISVVLAVMATSGFIPAVLGAVLPVQLVYHDYKKLNYAQWRIKRVDKPLPMPTETIGLNI